MAAVKGVERVVAAAEVGTMAPAVRLELPVEKKELAAMASLLRVVVRQ